MTPKARAPHTCVLNISDGRKQSRISNSRKQSKISDGHKQLGIIMVVSKN